MRYCIGPRYINDKLKELQSKGIKVEKIKRFKGYDYFVQSSILQIAENIGNILEFDCVTIEPNLPSGDADIKFIDDDVYYLQVKSPLFFRSKYGHKFSDISKEFNRILTNSKSRFAVGYVVGSSLIPIYVKDVNKPGKRVSLGILAYNPLFVPTSDIVRKMEDMLYEANNQLGEIQEKSWKIFILDVTHYPTRGNLDFYNLLAKISKQNTFKSIDGIGLFSWNLAKRNDYTLPSTIIPVLEAFKRGIRSKVFRQPFQLYQGMMITLPTSMRVYKGWNKLLEINKEGYIGVDGIEYGDFWGYIKLLSNLNQILAKYRLYGGLI